MDYVISLYGIYIQYILREIYSLYYTIDYIISLPDAYNIYWSYKLYISHGVYIYSI